MARINEIIQNIENLPAFPATAAKLLCLLQTPSWEADDVGKIVRNDEAISAAVLRCANSALFGSPIRTFNLNESVVRLGGKNLLKVALKQKVTSLFKNAGSSFGLRRGELWRSALGGAIAAELLVNDHPVCDPELAYVSALMRDLGKLVLDQEYGNTYRDMIAPYVADNKRFCQIERDALGYDHAQLGAALASKWGLPEPIPAAIEHHHNPLETNDEHHCDVCDVVHAADMLALWAGLAIGDDGMQYKIAEHVRQRFNLGSHQIEQYVAAIWVALDAIEDTFTDSAHREVSA